MPMVLLLLLLLLLFVETSVLLRGNVVSFKKQVLCVGTCLKDAVVIVYDARSTKLTHDFRSNCYFCLVCIVCIVCVSCVVLCCNRTRQRTIRYM